MCNETPKARREISLAEVAEHRRADDGWLAIENEVYDVSNFAHPGGPLIYSGLGTDATVLFRTYHFASMARVRRVLEKHRIGHLKDNNSPQMGEFYDVVSKRVAAFMKDTGLEKRPFITKALFVLDCVALAVLLVWSVYLSRSSYVGYVLACWFFTFGIFLPRVQQQSHALDHMQLFGPAVTVVLDHVCVLLGSLSSNAYALPEGKNMRRLSHMPRETAQYELKYRGPYEHQAIHHVRGAVMEHDGCHDTAAIYGMLRLSPAKPWEPHHVNQANPLYLFAVSTWFNMKVNALGVFLGRIAMTRMSLERGTYRLAISSFLSIGTGILLMRLTAVLFFHSAMGVVLYCVANLIITAASLNPTRGLLFHAQHTWHVTLSEEESNKDWGKYNTTTCYSLQPPQGDRLWDVMAKCPSLWQALEAYLWSWHPVTLGSAGTCASTVTWHLEHTLFPGVNYFHLSKIGAVIEETCEEFNLPYNKITSIGALHEERLDKLRRFRYPQEKIE